MHGWKCALRQFLSLLSLHDDVQAKKMHIIMCIKASLHNGYGVRRQYLLMLLDKLASICAENADSSPLVMAINQALPGRCHGLLLHVLWVIFAL